MTNADKFKHLFGIYATELWSMPEKEFLKWLNSEVMNSSEIPNNSDTIYRQAAIDAIAELTSSMSVCISVDECHGMKRMQGMAVRALEGLPSAQPKPKTGHWIEIAQYSDGKHKIECSECGNHIFDRGHANSFNVKNKYKYCPNCGAKMVEPQESEEKQNEDL
jgi:hypothetical protein